MPLNEATKGNAQNDATNSHASLLGWYRVSSDIPYCAKAKKFNFALIQTKECFSFVHCLSNKFQMRFYSSILP